MEVCKELKDLAKEFKNAGYKLYIVGGWVRDELLGLPSEDIDITSNMPSEKVLKISNKLKLKANTINKELGTIQIIFNSKIFEYTRFRHESYLHDGTHTPEKIQFVDKIETDCLRRDFTINSLYYDIVDNRILDFVKGQKDLESRIIKTTQDPEITFADDGLRILRAIRFASTLDFHIEKSTLKALRIYTPYLKSISKERILKELKSLAIADHIHGKKNTQFLTLMNKLDLPKYLFNSTLSRSKKFTKRDIANFYNISKDARLIGL